MRQRIVRDMRKDSIPVVMIWIHFLQERKRNGEREEVREKERYGE